VSPSERVRLMNIVTLEDALALDWHDARDLYSH